MRTICNHIFFLAALLLLFKKELQFLAPFIDTFRLATGFVFPSPFIWLFLLVVWIAVPVLAILNCFAFLCKYSIIESKKNAKFLKVVLKDYFFNFFYLLCVITATVMNIICFTKHKYFILMTSGLKHNNPIIHMLSFSYIFAQAIYTSGCLGGIVFITYISYKKKFFTGILPTTNFYQKNMLMGISFAMIFVIFYVYIGLIINKMQAFTKNTKNDYYGDILLILMFSYSLSGLITSIG